MEINQKSLTSFLTVLMLAELFNDHRPLATIVTRIYDWLAVGSRTVFFICRYPVSGSHTADTFLEALSSPAAYGLSLNLPLSIKWPSPIFEQLLNIKPQIHYSNKHGLLTNPAQGTQTATQNHSPNVATRTLRKK